MIEVLDRRVEVQMIGINIKLIAVGGQHAINDIC